MHERPRTGGAADCRENGDSPPEVAIEVYLRACTLEPRAEKACRSAPGTTITTAFASEDSDAAQVTVAEGPCRASVRETFQEGPSTKGGGQPEPEVGDADLYSI